MRIVLDLQGAQNDSRFRGIGRYTVSLARQMVRSAGDRHEIHVLLNRNLPEGLASMAAAFEGLLPRSRMHLLELPGPTLEAAPENAWRSRAAELVREAALHALAPDLVHVASLFEGFGDNCVSSIGALGLTLPTAITLYDMIPLLQPEIYLADQRARLWYDRRAQFARRADLLLAISDFSASEGRSVLGLPPDRVVTIGAGVDAKFRPVAVSDASERCLRRRYRLHRPFVLYAGAADTRKNLRGLVEGFAHLPAALRSRHCLAIVGRLAPEEIARVEADAVATGLGAEDLVFAGFVPDDDLIELYALCAVLVFPSFHEGFGLPAAEAMACGAAVIASDRTSLPEVVGRADALFDPTEPTSIAERLERVLTDAGFRDELRRHGPVQIGRFTWEDVARRSLDAFERLHARGGRAAAEVPAYRSMPRVAMVAPLLPERGATARHAARMLVELATTCDMVVVADIPVAPSLECVAPVYSHGWLRDHIARFDAVLYSLADATATPALLETLRASPGCVLLHDAAVSSMLLRINGAEASRLLYTAHGWHAVLHAAREGMAAAARRFDCLLPFLETAELVVTHSPALARQVREQLCHGLPEVICVPPPAASPIPRPVHRAAARARLGLLPDDFVACALAFDDAAEVPREVIDGWQSRLCGAAGDRLLFAGGHDHPAAAAGLRNGIARFGCDQMRVVQAPHTVTDALFASDMVLQVGPVPGAEAALLVPDLLRAGVTVLSANAAAWSALPADMVVALSPEIDAAAIADALDRLRARRGGRDRTSPAGADTMASRMRDALRGLADDPARAAVQALRCKLPGLQPGASAELGAAWSMARANRGRAGPPRLLVDVSCLAMPGRGGPLQRLCRSLASELTADPPPGFRVEPVRWHRGNYVFAEHWVRERFGLHSSGLADAPAVVAPSDLYLGFGPDAGLLEAARPWFEMLRLRGVQIMFVSREPREELALADAVIVTSRACLDETLARLGREPSRRAQPLRLGWLHPGADLQAALPDKGPSAAAWLATRGFDRAETVLSVVEAGHDDCCDQALAAFEKLWSAGRDVTWAIVGDGVWGEGAFPAHPERDRRLFWLDDADDETLAWTYHCATGFLSASRSAGSGQSLLEASQFDLPVLVRDNPVFRELTAGHASFFETDSSGELAGILEGWLHRCAASKAASSIMMPRQSWRDSARRLAELVAGDGWNVTWTPPGNSAADAHAGISSAQKPSAALAARSNP